MDPIVKSFVWPRASAAIAICFLATVVTAGSVLWKHERSAVKPHALTVLDRCGGSPRPSPGSGPSTSQPTTDQNRSGHTVPRPGTFLPHPTAILQHPGPVTSVVFSPDGRTLVSVSHIGNAEHSANSDRDSRHSDATELARARDALSFWNAATGHLIRRLIIAGEIGTPAFTPDGQRLLAGCSEGQNRRASRLIKEWNVNTGALMRTIPFPWWGDPVFSADGRIAAVAVESGEPTPGFQKTNQTDEFDPEYTGILILNGIDLRPRRFIRTENYENFNLVLSPRGDRVASALWAADAGAMGLSVWSTSSGHCLLKDAEPPEVEDSFSCFLRQGNQLVLGQSLVTIRGGKSSFAPIIPTSKEQWQASDWFVSRGVPIGLSMAHRRLLPVEYGPVNDRSSRLVKLWDIDRSRVLIQWHYSGDPIEIIFPRSGRRMALFRHPGYSDGDRIRDDDRSVVLLGRVP